MGVNRDKMRLLLEGPILTRSGYGEHARLVFRSLAAIPNLEIQCRCVDWGKTSWITDHSDELRNSITSHNTYMQQCQEDKEKPHFDVQVFVGILNEFEKKAEYSVVVTAGIETDRVSPKWLLKTMQGVNKLIVPSEHAKKGFVDTTYEVSNQSTGQQTVIGCRSDVEVVPYPVKTPEIADLDLDLTTDFNFLNIALLGPRKNLENSVEWFLEEFKDNPDVGLVLKTAQARSSLFDRARTEIHLENILRKHKDSKCKVYLLHGNMTEGEIHSLYVHPKIKAFATATCGEGYGLPIFEAAYSGLPIVATDWSAHPEFLEGEIKENGKVKRKKLFAKVDYTLKKIPESIVWQDVLVEDSVWAYANPVSYKAQLKKMYNNYGMYKKWATVLKSEIESNYSEEKIMNEMVNAILSDVLTENNASKQNGGMNVSGL